MHQSRPQTREVARLLGRDGGSNVGFTSIFRFKKYEASSYLSLSQLRFQSLAGDPVSGCLGLYVFAQGDS